MKKELYFTMVGTKYYYGQEFMKPDMEVTLEKEPDNEYDKEAIQVKMKALGKVGYVANNTFTVQGESVSAGRLYDKIDDGAVAKILYVTEVGVICKLVDSCMEK